MKKWKQDGFTLVEVIVVAGIIAILAGVLVPLILKEIDESRISRAYGDVRSISSAILVMKKDTAKWPNMDGNCDANVTLLTGDGAMPANLAANNFDGTTPLTFNSYFPADDTGCYGAKWKGAYMAWVTADPWGNSYVTNASSFGNSNPVWILSAGPDGQVDTDANGTSLRGDDVGIRIK